MNTVVVSDELGFLEAAAGLGCAGILVGNAGTTRPKASPLAHAPDLMAAVEILLGSDGLNFHPLEDTSEDASELQSVV
jgi:hypothetical protein